MRKENIREAVVWCYVIFGMWENDKAILILKTFITQTTLKP